MDKRLIDAEELKRRIIAFTTGVHTSYLVTENIIMMINQADTVDTVEVVRCAQCKYFGKEVAGYYDDEYYCTNPVGLDDIVKPDDFCSYGVRRDEP